MSQNVVIATLPMTDASTSASIPSTASAPTATAGETGAEPTAVAASAVPPSAVAAASNVPESGSGSATPRTPAEVLARPAVQRVLAALKAAGIASTEAVRIMPESASTAATAAAQIGCEVGAIANSLIFEAHGKPLLVLTSGGHRVDTKALGPRLGLSKSAIKRAKPDFVKLHTGYSIGGVAPLGFPSNVRTIVDPELERYPEVWAAAGHHQAVFPIPYPRLVEVTKGEVLKVD